MSVFLQSWIIIKTKWFWPVDSNYGEADGLSGPPAWQDLAFWMPQFNRGLKHPFLEEFWGTQSEFCSSLEMFGEL